MIKISLTITRSSKHKHYSLIINVHVSLKDFEVNIRFL